MIITLWAIELGIAADDDHVTGTDQVGGRTVNADYSRISSSFNGIRRQSITVGDVVDLNLLIFDDIGQLHQLDIDCHTTFVMQLSLGDRGSVDLGFQEDSVHALNFNNNLTADSRGRMSEVNRFRQTAS